MPTRHSKPPSTPAAGAVAPTRRAERPRVGARARALRASAILAAICGLLGSQPHRAAADALIAQTAEPTPVSAYGEVMAWSASTESGYRLMVKVGSTVRTVPTPPEPRAFDASVGANQSNAPVVLFSRCRRYDSDPSELLFGEPGNGCRVYQYDVDTGVVAAMALGQSSSDSFTDPSQWGSHVAVVASSRRARARIEVISLSGHRRAILPGGTLSRGLVDSLRIVGNRVVATWYAAHGLATEIVLDTMGGAREILEEGEQGGHTNPQIADPTGSEFVGAGLAGAEAYWVEPGDPLIGTASVVEFYNPLTQTSTVGEGAPDVFSVAPDGATLYYSTGSNAGGCPCGVFER
jgi:hypothetical protein